MSRAVSWTVGEIASVLALLALIAFIVAFPPFIGYLVWMAMSPVGFWQVIAGLVFEIVLMLILYPAEFAALAIVGAML